MSNQTSVGDQFDTLYGEAGKQARDFELPPPAQPVPIALPPPDNAVLIQKQYFVRMSTRQQAFHLMLAALVIWAVADNSPDGWKRVALYLALVAVARAFDSLYHSQ